MTNTLSGYLWLISGFNFRQFHCKNIRIYFNPVYPKFNIALQKYDFWLFHGHFCPENWPILTVRSFKATWWRQKTGIFISSLESPGKTLRCPLMKNSIFYLSILFLSGFFLICRLVTDSNCSVLWLVSLSADSVASVWLRCASNVN